MKLLENKRGLVFGVANNMSIAWAIAQEAHRQGAELGFTYLNEALEKRMRPLAESLEASLILPCDANNDEELDAVFAEAGRKWGKLDFVLHAIAYAQREDLDGRFVDTSREGFRVALDTSAYSLVAMARRATPLMTEGGNLLTLTYYGSQKVVPNYNVMGVAKAALEASVRYLAADLGAQGIRVNALSAGAIKTLSAKGIRNLNEMLKVSAERSPLGRNVFVDEVARAGTFLLSDYASGITGDILYVDAGWHVLGM